MKKNILLLLGYVCISSLLWAQVVPEAVYRQADSALLDQAVPQLDPLLKKNTAQAWYPRLESYILKKARQMVIMNELEQAKAVSLALIDNNLDNKEAVDLYQSVQAAIVKRENEKKKTAEQESVSTFKQATAESKIKQDIAKTYKTSTNTTTGKKVYLDQDFNNTYRSYTWSGLLGLANAGLVTDSGGQNVKYGLSAEGSLFYHGEGFTFGADIEGTAMLLTFIGDQALNWTGGIILSGAANGLSKYLVLRGGYTAFGYDSGSLVKSASVFATPVVGVGFRDVRMGESGRLQFGLDYYPGHLFEDSMLVALGGNIVLTFVLAKLQDFDIQFKTGLKDTVLIYADGLKNDAKLVLSIGVGNYE